MANASTLKNSFNKLDKLLANEVDSDSREANLVTKIHNLKTDSVNWFTECQKNGKTDEIRNKYALINRRFMRLTSQLSQATSELQNAWEDMSMTMLTRNLNIPNEDDEFEIALDAKTKKEEKIAGIYALDEITLATILKARGLSIFISYYVPSSEAEVKRIEAEVNLIEECFNNFGLTVVRVTSLGYMGDIEEFMKKVRTTSFALLLINKEFLQSMDTMKQVLHLQKDENYKNRMTILMNDEVDIGSASKVAPYTKFWEDQFSKIKKDTENASPEARGSLYLDAKQLSITKIEIADFLTSISRLKVLSYEKIKQQKFLPLLRTIAIRTIVDPN